MGKNKSTMVLGYTRGGHAVLLPTSHTPDASDFGNWTAGDHRDASRILAENGERETAPIGPWCTQWAGAHRAMSKRSRKKAKKASKRASSIRGAAEVVIRGTRRR